ncbi:PucR family transcriptional regulator [Pimelobacter sp. 30-1]|nr:PucR family transcriptional regulator [Pimelobacter sp. 30-1]
MGQRPRASLGRVLDDLGDTLLELVHGDPEHEGDIGGVIIHDPDDEPIYPIGALVLAVGASSDSLATLVRDLGRHHAVGVVVRAPVAVTPEISAAVEESGVALLGLRRGATWTQLNALLRSVLAEGDVGVSEKESLGGIPSGDLFAVANAVAALIDAPVTIEDRSSRVLAFSGRQDEADASRVETVIGRQVPERYTRRLTERGVFRELYRQDLPVVVNPEGMGSGHAMQRVAIAVRAGDEVLGSIWAAMDGELTAERSAAFQDSAKLVALHLLRVRAGADAQRRLQADLVATTLEGASGSRDALARLGLAGKTLTVLAAALRVDEGDRREQALAADWQRLTDAFSVHLSAAVSSAAVARVGSAVYALVPLGGDAEERAVRLANDFCDRVGVGLPMVVAVGPPADNITSLILSRASADRVLHVLRDGRTGRRVARLSDVQTQSLLLELRDLAVARGDRPAGPIACLLEYDESHDSGLIETLKAWLDAFGDVTAAASVLFIHPNTLRYRLRRLADVSGMDLDDPEDRFEAMVQLRILASR